MKKTIIALFAVLSILAVSSAVVFAAGHGNRNAEPTTVAEVHASAWDEQRVILDGEFTQHLRGDKYIFTDENGDSIRADVDDDIWYQISLNEPVRVYAEVDKDRHGVEIEVNHIQAK